MSMIAAAVRELMALGVQGEALVAAIERLEAAQRNDGETARQAQNRRAYEKRKLLKPAENAENLLNSAPAENLLKPAEIQRFSAPLARGEDNLLTTEVPCRTDDDEDASAWDRARLDGLTRRLREEAGEALDTTSPNLLNISPIVRLLRGGQGPRCDLELDVIPAVRVLAAKARRGSVRSWDYFRQSALENRDARLSGAPAGVVVDFSARAQGPPPGSYAAEEANQARIRAEVRQRLLEAP